MGPMSTWTAPEVEDTRADLPMTTDERETLESWVEMYRETVPLKVAGLTGEQLCRRSVPPSTLSLLGVVRHLTEVERYWYTDVVRGEDSPDIYSHEGSPEGDLDDATPESAEADLATYAVEVEQARRHAAEVTDLAAPVLGRRHGRPVSLRWIHVHVVEEYARHLGHMDLLREAVDGRTGY